MRFYKRGRHVERFEVTEWFGLRRRARWASSTGGRRLQICVMRFRIRIRRSVRAATTKAALARVEDRIDAVVCAHVGRLAAACPDRVRVLGTVGDGYILTPVTPQIAARIDADLRNSPRSPVGAGVRVTLNQGPGRVPEVGEAR